MAENVSWLKKPSAILSRRTIHMKDLADVNSTINMINSKQGDIVARPPKRKSCMMFKERKIVQVPSEKKVKPNQPGKTEFKNRTLKMVQGQRFSMQRPGVLRQRSQLPCPRPPEVHIKTSPLHMSTPCEPPRSILKLQHKETIMTVSACKKVNFDNVETGVFPLQESTIQDFTQYDFRKPLNISKVDVSTNTEDILPESNVVDVSNNILTILMQFKKDILEGIGSKLDGIEGKIDLLTENVCACKTPVNNANQMHQYLSQLDDIREDNESDGQSTPDEGIKIKETTENSELDKEESMKSAFVAYSKLSDVQEERCSSSEVRDEFTLTTNDNSEKESNILKSNVNENLVVQAINNSLREKGEEKKKDKLVIDESTESVTSSDTERKTRACKLQVSSPIRLKLRHLRKRNIPRHFQSFELSPKPKRGVQRE